MSSETEELENMVLSFRVSELQMLLGFAGRNKSGRKNELQQRALELLRLRSHPVNLKIRELYKTIQADQLTTHQLYGESNQQQIEQTMHQRNYFTRQTQSLSQQQAQQAAAAAAAKDLPPAHQASMPPNQRSVYPQPTYNTLQPRNPLYYPYGEPKAMGIAGIPLAPAQYPVHPDVRFRKLPFFDHMGELLRPSSLMPHNNVRIQENTFMFHLTPQQATDIASSRDCRPGAKVEYTVQVQMRFCLQESSCEQEDNFPPSVGVKINNKICPLPNPIPTNKPGVEPKRPPRPVNISPLVKLSPTVSNQVNVSWAADYGRRYAVAIYLVRKLSSTDLLSRMKSKGVKHSDYTRGLIKEKLNEDADSEIATTSLRVSLACPLGKMRMSTPCRASTCFHLQCFDASLFLQMNERKPTWNCPVCDKPALFDNLTIDGYFQEVLGSNKLLPDVNEIQLLQDGSWENLVPKKEKDKEKSESLEVSRPPDVDVTLDLDEPSALPSPSTPKEKKRALVIDLISDSSDDENESIHSVKRPALAPSIKPQTSVISSTSDSPELLVIDLE